MTICLAIRCNELIDNEIKPVVLFASDTQESSSHLKRSVVKIRSIYGRNPKKQEKPWGILVASAGDALVIDEVYGDLNYFLREKINSDEEKPSIRLGALRKQIGDIAYATYKKYSDREAGEPEFELLLGACDELPKILYVTCEGKTQELDRFGIIGSGRITGGELLLHELIKEDISKSEAASLAALVVTRVGNVDISVGGLPDIQFCRDRIIWVFKDAAFSKILESSESKWKTIKVAWWRMQKDATVEGRLNRLLKKRS